MTAINFTELIEPARIVRRKYLRDEFAFNLALMVKVKQQLKGVRDERSALSKEGVNPDQILLDRNLELVKILKISARELGVAFEVQDVNGIGPIPNFQEFREFVKVLCKLNPTDPKRATIAKQVIEFFANLSQRIRNLVKDIEKLKLNGDAKYAEALSTDGISFGNLKLRKLEPIVKDTNEYVLESSLGNLKLRLSKSSSRISFQVPDLKDPILSIDVDPGHSHFIHSMDASSGYIELKNN